MGGGGYKTLDSRKDPMSDKGFKFVDRTLEDIWEGTSTMWDRKLTQFAFAERKTFYRNLYNGMS